MNRLSKRFRQLPTYPFARLDELAGAAAAKGLEVVSMGIGDPDRDPPQWIRELLCEEVMRGGNHRYPSYKGNPQLFDSAIRFLQRRFGITGLTHANIMTTIGSKEGLASMATAVLNPGDSFITPDPMYPVFANMARVMEAQAITVPVHPSTHFMPDLSKELNEHQVRGCRVMYINYPHNPTGQVASREYLRSLVNFARDNSLILVSDAAYTEVYYNEEQRPASLLEFDGALDCTIEFHSFSKSFNMTGWRCGFAAGNPDLITALYTVKSNIDSGCFNAIQLAMARALDDERCDAFLAENRAHYHQRLDRVCDALTEMGVTYYRPGASIFVWCDLPGGERDSFDWCGRLLDSTGLVVSPGAAYGQYGEGFFRISLSTPDAKIDAALERLRGFVRGSVMAG